MRLQVLLFIPLLVLSAASCSKSNEIDIDNGPAGNNDRALPSCDPADPPISEDPAQVQVGRLDGTCSWMDQTEVTRAQYKKFLDATKSGLADHANVELCQDNNDSFEPTLGSSPEQDWWDSLPMTAVDWCDAAAYCKWAGKTLCSTYPVDGDDVSELEVVCTDGDHAGFEYDTLMDSNTCNGGGSEALAPVKEFAGCITPTLVYDLVGNAAEWVDECDGPSFEHGCLIRGGSFQDNGTDWGCKARRTMSRTYTSEFLGFRCCAAD